MLNKKKHSSLWLYFSTIVFATMMTVFLFVLVLWVVLFKIDVVSISPFGHRMPIVVFLAGSVLIGAMITLFVGKLIIKPIQKISTAFEQVSKGDFEVRACENEKITEISDMAKCFNAMVYDLSHIETLRNDFVVNVSHEFKTPIASIEGYAELLQNPNLSEEKRSRYIEKITDNSQRLSTLLTNVLALSKLENQKTVLNKKEYRLDEQIRRVILLLEEKWTKKNIDFEIDLQSCYYCTNESLLDRVWFNLIDNAIKYSNQNGKVVIKLDEGENDIFFSITNDGCTISSEAQKHIFEKFYQGDSSRKNEGNGLGLSIVKSIVDLCGGEIYVKSDDFDKTKFVVKLPK